MTQQPSLLETKPTRYSLTISMEKANANALLIAPIVAAILIVPHVLLWGVDGLLGWLTGSLLPTILIVPVLIASIYLHEILHGLGFILFGQMRIGDISLGFNRKTLSPYIHCTEPVAASAYKVSLVMPGLLLGVMPAVIGIVVGIGWLTLYGMLMSVAALGDAQIAWLMRSLPGRTRVVDHPEEVGCEVLVA
ncbi:MAG: DUF3267 domain-containing protein [Anaerolineae bacterium]|nr:DUF3267 domain-containing protein [Anaerolineae bacterium]